LDGVQAGREAAALMAAGAVDGLSIGYRVRRAEPITRAGRRIGRRLIEIDLWEVSLVTFPMLPTARASLEAPRDGAGLAGALALAMRQARHTRPSPSGAPGQTSDHSKRDER
ncbi:MAG: HK97 family phage prohead protease, partial [Pseudomonadota bacterium]